MIAKTNPSKSAEVFDLSELSRSQQSQLWTQVDNWAVAVVLANFCKRPTIEERMLRIATRCIAASRIKEIVDRFHAKMNAVEGIVWDCTDRTVQTFVEKTATKANLLVDQAEDACRQGAVYRLLLPFVE